MSIVPQIRPNILFNRKFNRLPPFGAVFLLSILFLWSSAQIDAAPLVQSTEETAEPPCPASTSTSDTVSAPRLDLVWHTGGTPDEIVGALVSDKFNTGWLGVDFEGNVYTVIDVQGGSVIKKFDTDGNFVMSFESSVSGGTGIDADSQGNIYLNDFKKAQVLKFDNSGKFLMQWATEAPTGPTGMAVDTEGNVTIGNHRPHDHYVQRFDSSGQLLAQWGSSGKGDEQFSASGTGGAEGLAVGENGNVYVTDPGKRRILIFDHEGNFLTALGEFGTKGHGKFAAPFGVSLDGDGNIYVAEAHFIQKFDQDGQFLTQWDATEGELDSGGYYAAMAVDTHGNIYWLALSEVYVTSVQQNETLIVLKKFRQC